MGSVSSRWKKVAPASPAEDPALCGSLGGHSCSRSAGGLDSHSSADGEEDLSAELDRILAEYQVLESKEGAQRRAALPRGGFGPSDRAHGGDFRWTAGSQRSEDTPNPVPSGPSESVSVRDEEEEEEEGDEEEDQGSGTQLSNLEPRADGLQDLTCTKEADSVPGSSGGSLVTVPVIQYDKSEEDLMETIEREFS